MTQVAQAAQVTQVTQVTKVMEVFEVMQVMQVMEVMKVLWGHTPGRRSGNSVTGPAGLQANSSFNITRSANDRTTT